MRQLLVSVLLAAPLAHAADYAMEGPRTVSIASTEIRAAISPDGARIVWGSPDREGGPGGWDLWQARRDGEAWIDPQPLALNTAAKEFDPAFSADGRWLYFFSNRDGGYGGGDLYRAAVTADGYGAAENLGAGVNGAGDEWAPLPSADGTALLFASDGFGGAGGHDLFVARWDGTRWSEPRGVDGVNTAADEFDGTWIADGRGLVFARSNDADAEPIALWTSSCDGRRWRAPAPLALPFAGGDYVLGPTVDPTRPREMLISAAAPSPRAGGLDIYRIPVPDTDGLPGCDAHAADARGSARVEPD